MPNHRTILQLLLEERPWAETTEIASCSRRDISKVKSVIADRQVTSADTVTEDMLAEWFPDRRRARAEYVPPDFAGVLAAQKASKHFTLQLAWNRYVDAPGIGKKYGYSQFCSLYAEYVDSNDLVAVLHHDPGRALFVDWAGDTMTIVDQTTGTTAKAYLFVAVLPYSGMVFCHAYLNMKTSAWLDAHIRAFTFFDGVVQLVVPDNAATATHRMSKADRARVVTTRYQELADHYAVAIVPAGVKRPRHKAAVESAVNVINTRVIGYLEDSEWATIDELNSAIASRIHEINHELRRKDDTTRFDRFDAEEREHLAGLPQTQFEEVDWKILKVGRNYHISADGQHYSVPYRMTGRQVRVRLTRVRVTVFDGEDVVCEHSRRLGRKGQYSTLAEHVPPQHEHLKDLYSREWFLRRARGFGPATVEIIEQVLDRHAIEAQGYLDCQNILSTLGKKNRPRLEAACQELIRRGGYATYTTLKRILATIDSDQKAPPRPRPVASAPRRAETANPGPDVFVRDPSHYDLSDEDGER